MSNCNSHCIKDFWCLRLIDFFFFFLSGQKQPRGFISVNSGVVFLFITVTLCFIAHSSVGLALKLCIRPCKAASFLS